MKTKTVSSLSEKHGQIRKLQKSIMFNQNELNLVELISSKKLTLSSLDRKILKYVTTNG
jgi:hypothetical protein